MIAPRYAPALCVVVGLALIPTLIHSYAGVVVRDGRSAQAISESLAGFTSTASGRHRQWGSRHFESDDWFERRYVAGTDEVLFTVVRSYDQKRLYHHPELAVAYGTSFTQSQIRHFGKALTIPVHVLRSAPEVGPLGMYVLQYGDGFVEDPIRFQILTAGKLLFSGRAPMTLFFVQDSNVPRDTDPANLRSAELLLAAIREFIDPGRASR